jgi:aspartate aminotransferase
VLSDEIYSRLLFEGGQHFSIMSVPGMQERTILLDGFSKTYAMTGWRMGYGVMRADLAAQISRLMTNSNSCTASFTQVAGIEALLGDQSAVDRDARLEFQRRSDVFVAGLNKIKGFSCAHAERRILCLPNITGTGWKSKPLADALLEEAGVAALSGTAFGSYRRRLPALQRRQLHGEPAGSAQAHRPVDEESVCCPGFRLGRL